MVFIHKHISNLRLDLSKQRRYTTGYVIDPAHEGEMTTRGVFQNCVKKLKELWNSKDSVTEKCMGSSEVSFA